MLLSATLIDLIEEKRKRERTEKKRKKDTNVKWDLLRERRESIEVGEEMRKNNGGENK